MYRRIASDPPLPLKAPNAASPLTVPTYEGSGQTTHPDVIDMKSQWNGYRFWMANTPYPNEQTIYENPCIWASNDGETWVEPAGITNPIQAKPTPPGEYNSDPTIVFDKRLQKMLVFFRMSYDENGNDVMRRIESSNGVTWTNSQTVLSFSGDATAAVAPQVYIDPSSGRYSMWTVRTNGCSSTYDHMERWTSPDGFTWTKVGNVNVNVPGGHQPWHLNLKPYNGYFVGVIYCYPSNCSNSGKLFFIRSTDTTGDNLQIIEGPILQKSATSAAWDSWTLYQSCMLPVDGRWYLWYSGHKRESDNVTFTLKMGLLKLS